MNTKTQAEGLRIGYIAATDVRDLLRFDALGTVIYKSPDRIGGAEAVALYTAAPAIAPAGGDIPRGVGEALQRMIEDGLLAGPASAEDARLVTQWMKGRGYSTLSPAAPQDGAQVVGACAEPWGCDLPAGHPGPHRMPKEQSDAIIGRGAQADQPAADDGPRFGTNANPLEPLTAARNTILSLRQQLAATIAERTKDADRLDAIEEGPWTVQAVAWPTGGGDADVGWEVVSYNMAAPHLTIRGVGANPREAIDAAIAAAAGDAGGRE